MNVATIEKLVENYTFLENTLVEELKIDKSSNMQSAEQIWKPVFERIVPAKYKVDTNVYIIDSKRNISQKVSIAIYDEQYTPYIFNFGVIKYIPIEAVFVTVLCSEEKQETGSRTEEEQTESGWLKSIAALETQKNAFARTATGIIDTKKKPNEKETQIATRPITVLCTTKKQKEVDMRDGRQESGKKLDFDIMLFVNLDKSEENPKKIEKVISEQEACFKAYWFVQLNRVGEEGDESEGFNHAGEEGGESEESNRVDEKSGEQGESKRTLSKLAVKDDEGKEYILLTLMFQLNQLLMIINNPMFFPHQSYAEMFGKEGKEKNEDE